MEEIRKSNYINRIVEIDLLKGFGIVLMIMGHIGFGKAFDTWIHSFHMPIFFVISGFLWKKRNISFKDFFKRKASSLLIPYCFFSIFHLIVWTILQLLKNHFIEFSSVVSTLFHIFIINTDGMPICGALWFLTALFFVEVIYFFIDRIRNKYLKYVAIISLSFFGCIMPGFFRLPLGMDISFMGVGLFQIGNILRTADNLIKIESNLFFIILSILLGSLICFINIPINVRSGIYGNILLYYTCVLLMTIGWYAFFKFFFKCKILKSIMIYIGQNSIVYLCLNQITLLLFNEICVLITSIYILIIVKILILIVTLITLYIFSILLNKDCKWILGK